MMKKRFISLQILRVCACILVFCVHFGQRVNFHGVIRDFTDFGKYGVQLFFLISGFLVGNTFFDNPSINIKNYYVKRMVAILPLYYLVILYYFISENILNQYFSVIPSDHLGIGWLRYVFLLNGFLNSDTYFWSNLGITWTIPIFMFFYLIAPWMLRKAKTISSVSAIWLFVYAISKICEYAYSCTITNNLHILFLGVVIYACANKKCHLEAIAIFSLLAIFLGILGNQSMVYISLFSCIILALTALENIKLSEWLQRIIDTLDKYSYTLYLMHGVVFCSLLDRLNALGVSKASIGIIAIVGTFFATWVVGKFIEQPIQRYLRKRFVQ